MSDNVFKDLGCESPELLLRIADLEIEIERLRAERDAWKECAEHQYGLWRVAKYGQELDGKAYPVAGALDAWAGGRHSVLKKLEDE